MFNVEKGSQRYFGVTVLILSVILILSSLGKVSWVQWIAVFFSILLGLILYSEGGVRTYLASKGYRKVTANDLVVWMAFVFGTFLILNGVLLINVIRNVTPEWLVSLVSSMGIIGGVVAGLLGVFLVFTPRPKA